MSSFGYDLLGFGSSANTASATPKDDEFNRVSFLSNFDGANNGLNNAYDDGSASNRTVTKRGDAQQGSFGPFARPDGEWGITYNNGYVNFPDSADWTLGTTFTLEAFINPSILLAYNSIMHHAGWYFTVLANGALQVNGMGGNGDSTAGVVALNTWSHVAFSVSSGTGTFYVNGVARGTTSSNNIGNGSGAFYVGKQGTSNWPFYGTQSNYRVVKGTAVYTSNFTPPTAPLTAITNTVLLTGQSNRFIDNSASGHTAESGGTASAITAFGPFLTDAAYDPAVNGASTDFDGSSDSLAVANSSDFDLGQTFTIDTWLYRLDTQDGTIAGRWYGANNAHWIFHIYDSGKLSFGTGDDSYRDTTSVVLPVNSWVHVAVSNDSSGKRLYINGVQSGSHSQNNVTSGSSKVVAIAANSGGESPIKAYLYNLRIIKGTAVYTGSTYTVPTAPLTAITNTKLLLNMANGQAIDSTTQNNLKLIGGAKISTGQAKFGNTSMVFDGTGDFVRLIRKSDLTGPFTIETWAWADGTGTAFMWCHGQYKLELGMQGNTLRMYRVGTASEYTNFFTGGEFSVNTWHHVALVRDTNNVIKCYLNGTASGTTVTDATAFAATGGLFLIGGEYNNATTINNGWYGYLDDFRISKFARYINNFTPPTEPFPDQGQ